MSTAIGNMPPGFNLFIQGAPILVDTESITLAINGVNVGVGGVAFAAPLTITGSPMYVTMNLVVLGGDSGATSGLMNLIINGGNPTAGGNVSLYIENDNSEYDDQVSLYIAGAGANIDYLPYNESMNLFIQKGPEDGITLFICNTTTPATATLFIDGSVPIKTYLSSDVATNTVRYGVKEYNTFRFNQYTLTNNFAPTLFINGYGESVNSNVPLFVVGDVPVDINSQITLAMPNVVGPETKSAPLYVNGFNY